MSTDRVIFAKDGKIDWPAGNRAVTKIVLGTPPKEQGSTEKFITAKLPADLAERFPSLTHLHLWGIKNLRQLPKLPAGLKTLDVRNGTALAALPDTLPASLETFDAGRCAGLRTLPAALPTGLLELYLDHCTSLDRGALPPLPATLEVLDATGSHGVTELPGALLDESAFPALRDLRVEAGVRFGEHIAGPDILAPFQGKNALETLRAWWRGIRESGADTTPYVKVFLLGNGQAGKTQLCNLMSGKEVSEIWDTTHGAQLADIPPGGGRLQLPGVGLAVWDFGGQDIYHGTHALFTDSHAVYVIVWTRDPKRQGEKEAKPKARRYWLEYVAALSKPEPGAPAKGCRVVLAESGLAGGESHPDAEIPDGLIPTLVSYDVNPKLKEEQQLLAAGKQVLEHLREQAEAAARENQGSLPKSWAAVREALRADDLRAKRRLSSEEFAGLCREHGIDDEEGMRSVRGYLHQCGAIFHKPGLFDGRIVVDQQWALDAIYAVLDRRPEGILRHPERDGSFTIQELKRTVWREKSDEDAALLVQMMEECKVCFEWGQNDDGEKVWLAPELLKPREELQSRLIDTLRARYSEPLMSRSFRYDFLHDGILRGIMARAGSLAGTRAAYWKSGFCVYDRATGIYVVVEASLTPESDAGRGEITAELFGPADSRARGPWAWITGMLEEQRPLPDPADLKAAVLSAPEEFFGQPSGTAGVATFDKGGLAESGHGLQPGTPEWVITVEASEDFATSRRATIHIQKDGGRVPLPPTTKEFPAIAMPSVADFANYLMGVHAAPEDFEKAATAFGKALANSLRNPGLENDYGVSDEFAAACKQTNAFSTFRFQGGPEFQQIPWELMQASQGNPPALRFGFQRHRYALTDAEPIFPKSETLRVLWVTSRPLKWELPGGNVVFQPVDHDVRKRGVVIERLASGSLAELYERVSADAFHIVHLDMHGDVLKWADLQQWGPALVKLDDREPLGTLRPWEGEKAVLLFSEGGPGSRTVPVTAEELGRVMAHAASPPLLSLNACQSGVVPMNPKPAALPAYLVEAGVAGVVGFQGSVSVPLAVIFYKAFFAALAPTNRGTKVLTGDVEYAVREARKKLNLNPDRGRGQRMDWWAPVYYASRNLQLFRR